MLAKIDKTGKHFCWFEPYSFDLFHTLIVSLSLSLSLSHFTKSLKPLLCIYLLSIIVVRGRKINQTCPLSTNLLENHFQFVIIYINKSYPQNKHTYIFLCLFEFWYRQNECRYFLLDQILI